MSVIVKCRICGKSTGKKPNGFYCDACVEVLRRQGAYRYKITEGVYVWTKGCIKRAMVNGEDVTIIREAYEVVE